MILAPLFSAFCVAIFRNVPLDWISSWTDQDFAESMSRLLVGGVEEISRSLFCVAILINIKNEWQKDLFIVCVGIFYSMLENIGGLYGIYHHVITDIISIINNGAVGSPVDDLSVVIRQNKIFVIYSGLSQFTRAYAHVSFIILSVFSLRSKILSFYVLAVLAHGLSNFFFLPFSGYDSIGNYFLSLILNQTLFASLAAMGIFFKFRSRAQRIIFATLRRAKISTIST